MSPLRIVAVLLAVLALGQSAQAVRRRLAAASDQGPSFATPNFTIYHRQDELLREVVDIAKANAGFMKLDVLSDREGHYDAEIKVVTVEPGGFTEPSRSSQKVRVLLDFGEHGRELISSELGLLLLKTLAAKDGVARVFPSEPGRGRELQRVLEGTLLKILPMENEHGRRLVEAGRLCERKNGRGVDPNRNWAVDWGTKEPDYDPAEEYPGTGPFSEPETRILKRVAEEFKPQVWLNVHSGMEAMLAPWDHVAQVADEARPAVELLKRIHADLMVNTTCVVGSGGKSVGYLAHGTATDYMFKVVNVPIAYTWEIYGDFKAHFDDCFRMFNPVDEAGLQEVLQRWLKAILRLLELLPHHPALKDSKAWAAPQTSETAGQGQGEGSGSIQAGEGQGNVQGGGTALPTGTGATTSTTSTASTTTGTATGTNNATSTTSTTSSTTSSTSIQKPDLTSAAGPGDSSGSGSSSYSSGDGEAEPRVTVVSSLRDWGSSWGTQLFSALLALAGLVVVAVLAYRCLARPGGEQRKARGAGYQPV